METRETKESGNGGARAGRNGVTQRKMGVDTFFHAFMGRGIGQRSRKGGLVYLLVHSLCRLVWDGSVGATAAARVSTLLCLYSV